MNYLLRLNPCDIQIRGMAHPDALRHPLFGRRWFTDEVIITCVQWYLRVKLSYRDLAELARELGGQHRPAELKGFAVLINEVEIVRFLRGDQGLPVEICLHLPI